MLNHGKEGKMIISGKAVAVISLVTITGWSQMVWADTTKANCELRKQGELKKNASGRCTFSQRQGYVDIELHNGDSYSLKPANKANHFKDQKGRKVVRHTEGGNAQTYKWEHKKIIVTFNHDSNDSSRHHGGHSSGEVGDTPHNLRDLVGQRGGEAEDQLQARGYKLKNSSESGNAVYSNWKERSTGRCVTVRSVNGWYKSIVYSTDYDCKH